MIKGLISFLLNLLIVLVVVHAIGSWIPKIRESKAYQSLDSLLSPLLNPLRRILPPTGGLDLSQPRGKGRQGKKRQSES